MQLRVGHDRAIAVFAAEADEYSCGLLDVHLEIWTDGAGDFDHTNGFISADQSFVCLDNDDTGGMDVFTSQYGQIGVATKLWQSMPPLPPPAGKHTFGLFCLKSLWLKAKSALSRQALH